MPSGQRTKRIDWGEVENEKYQGYEKHCGS